MRRGSIIVLLLVWAWGAVAQLLPVRSNVVAYDDPQSIARLAYMQSPYYLELGGSWRQHRTDSSILYTRQLTADKVWKDYLVSLNVRCGHRCRVRLNGKEVGVAGDSRLYAEFLLNPYLKYGKENTLIIEALRNGDETLLEDPSIEVGLNGEPYIMFKSDPGIDDLGIEADYDAALGQGRLTLDVAVCNAKRKGKYYVEVELIDSRGKRFDRLGRWVVFGKNSVEHVELSREWNNIEPWSAENPVLYTLAVRLRDENMAEEELVGAQVGFRHVEVVDGLLQVNGNPITLKGVTYGIDHTEGEASRQQMARDLTLFKQNNINAVRTCRFSPMESYFYELCDRLGLYVVCDANLMPHSSRQHAVAADATFVPLFERRVENMYRRLRNHSSVVAWSLGNSRDNGVGMAAAYRRLKSLDAQRPILFSGADFGTTTDVIASVLPSVGAVRAAASKAGDRPVVLAAMAEDMSSVDALWQLVEQQRQVQGGFVDCSSFNAEQLADLKHLFMPIGISISTQGPDEVEFLFENRNCFVGFGDYLLEYTIFTNKRPNIVAGDLPLSVEGGGSVKERIRIPQLTLELGEEAFIRFDLRLRAGRERQWAGSGSLNMGGQVFPLRQQRMPRMPYSASGQVATTQRGDSLCLGVEGGLYLIGLMDGNLHLTRGENSSMAQLLPEVRDDNGRLCRVELTASNHSQPRADVAVVEYMGLVLREAQTVAELKMSYTVFASGDVIYDCQVEPRGLHRLNASLCAVMPDAENYNLQWYGLDGSSSLAVHSRGIPGVYSAVVGEELQRETAWWAVVGGRMYADFMGKAFDVCAKSDTLRLAPADDAERDVHLHAHLRMFGTEGFDPYTLSATDFPRVESGIPQPPTITASAVRFSEPMAIALRAEAVGEIRYTLDGSDPTPQSPLYKQPFTISNSTTVKARLFPRGGVPSFVATRHFNFDHLASVSFSRTPSVPYNVGADTLLYDGLLASADDLSHGWVGFSNADPTTIEAVLAKPISVGAVKVRFLHSPATWAFAPRAVSIVLLAADGAEVGRKEADVPIDAASEVETEARVLEMLVSVEGGEVQKVRIEARPIGRIPSWHRAKGLNPWLLMDEVEVIEVQ